MLPSPIQHPNTHCTSSTPLFLLMVPSIEPRASWILGKWSTIEIDSQFSWFILSVWLMRFRNNSRIVKYNSRYVYEGIFRKGWGKLNLNESGAISGASNPDGREVGKESRQRTTWTFSFLSVTALYDVSSLSQPHILQHLEITAPSAK